MGEERRSRQIARRIVAARRRAPIETSRRLAEIVSSAAGGRGTAHRIHPATRVFMALRIAVNRELERLEAFMAQVPDWLAPGGRLCVLSFHSLEDRIVKQHLRRHSAGCTCPPRLPVCACGRKPRMRVLTPKAVRPAAEEVAANPMARSTRLRAAERVTA